MGLCVRLALARLVSRSAALSFLLMLCVAIVGCRSTFSRTYEYEEDIHLSLDGSATIYVNSSVPALVALRGVDLPLDPRARLDRNEVRAVFESPATRVANVSLSRRDGRRYVHVRIEASDIRRVSTAAPFAWSTYALESRPEVYVYRQQLGTSAGKDVGDVGWTGGELVAIRLHLPSRRSPRAWQASRYQSRSTWSRTRSCSRRSVCLV
jgi:hypothetical protein